MDNYVDKIGRWRACSKYRIAHKSSRISQNLLYAQGTRLHWAPQHKGQLLACPADIEPNHRPVLPIIESFWSFLFRWSTSAEEIDFCNSPVCPFVRSFEPLQTSPHSIKYHIPALFRNNLFMPDGPSIVHYTFLNIYSKAFSLCLNHCQHIKWPGCLATQYSFFIKVVIWNLSSSNGKTASWNMKIFARNKGTHSRYVWTNVT